jgi:hypothetical protein
VAVGQRIGISGLALRRRHSLNPGQAFECVSQPLPSRKYRLIGISVPDF